MVSPSNWASTPGTVSALAGWSAEPTTTATMASRTR